MASTRVLTFGISPVGFLIGGVLGETIGLRFTLLAAGGGLLLSNLWLQCSPLGRIRDAQTLPSELTIQEP